MVTTDSSWLGIPFGKYIAIALLIIIVLFALWRLGKILRLFLVAALTPKGRITRIVGHVDGDTVLVTARGDKPESIRLIGVNTPESRKSPHMDIEPFGKEASDFTKQRLPKGQRVILLYDKEKKDKYGRTLAYLYFPSGEFYNATLVQEGYAWAAKYPPNTQYADYFEQLQQQAKARKRPIWQVYDEKGVLSKEYKKSADYKAFKRQHS